MTDDIETEYWITNYGSTPLWEIETGGMGNNERYYKERACLAWEGVWREWEYDWEFKDHGIKRFEKHSDGWWKVTKEKAYAAYPLAFPLMMEEEIKELQASTLKSLKVITILQDSLSEIQAVASSIKGTEWITTKIDETSAQANKVAELKE